MVVEKDNMVKFMITRVMQLIRLLATLILMVLAAIGLIALIYPDVRNELFTVLMQIWEQLRVMTGM